MKEDWKEHGMPHVHAGPTTGRRLGLSIILTLTFVVGEAVAGYLANSLALLSDAGHNFADALALILSWYAVRLARRPADARRTFGYHRAGVLAALVNAVSLVLIALFIFWEAIQRLRNPEPVQAAPMIGVAVIAVLLNGLISLWLRGEAQHDLNIRSAYLHMLGDAISAAGVVIAGVVLALTGNAIADSIVSLLIGVLILWSSWDILTEAVDVLLEAAPRSLDLARLVQAIQQVPGVQNVHDLHVWTISSGMAACSCHILVGDQSARDSQRVQQAVTELLDHEFHITHATIQVEVEQCGHGDDLHCSMRQKHGCDHGH
jgi:cobalt-zinc-cadmium efflux system protein